MKIGIILICFIILASCVTPVNLNFDTATMLEKRDVELQGSASAYFGTYDDFSIDNGGIHTNTVFGNVSNHLGAKVGIGINEKYNLKIRTEGEFLNYSSDITNSELGVIFIEIENKLGINDKIALALPLGGYFYAEEISSPVLYQFNPRLYWTVTRSQHFDLTFIPKGFLFFNRDGAAFSGGISLNAGFSSNLQKWALRPAFGYDTNKYFSLGIGFSYFLQSKTENNPSVDLK